MAAQRSYSCFALLPPPAGSEAEKKPRPALAATLDDLAWLDGPWRGEHSGTGEFYESWRREGDVMLGTGYQVVNGDTTFGEKLRIEPDKDKIYYVADVAHNNGEVRFALVDFSNEHAVFENPQHDFPQRIGYHLREDGILYVRASLMDEESGRVLQFFFRKAE